MDLNVEIGELRGEGEKEAAARSRMYAALAACFRFPSTEFFTEVVDGSARKEFVQLCGELPYPLRELPELAANCGYDDFQSEYIRLFDVGMGGPPCPLYGGHYGGTRMRVMEEVMRFYNHFGLSLSTSQRELPDHLTTELEFLHYLSFRETEALHNARDPGAYQRATRDFIERQILKWLPKLEAKLAKQAAPRFFTGIVALTQDFASRDKAWVTAKTEAENS